ncbi:MAG: polysaccharide biosynthesis protein [Betaproteobacteria bacterium]
MPEQTSHRSIGAWAGRPASIAVQLGFVVLSNWLAFLLRYDWNLPPSAREVFWQALPWLVALRAATFLAFRLNQGLWRYTSVYDVRAILGGVVASSLAFFAVTLAPSGPPVYPLSLFIVDAALLTLMLAGVRLSRRMVAEASHPRRGRRILIVGAGDAGELLVRDIKSSRNSRYRAVGFVDDDPSKVGHRIHGVPVLGTRADLPQILSRHRPHEVLLAIPDAEPVVVRSIVKTLEPFKVPIKTVPNLRDLIDGRIELSQIRSLSVDDLLTRAPIGLARDPLKHLIGGRRVMVTGAGGSIGSELCRQIARLKPASLVMFERYENSLHAIRMELEDARQQFGLHPVIGDVTDPERLAEVMRETRPEIVFHAAAHKHVPLMEENPCEAIKNNVRGTRLVAQAADEYGVDRFILISTDKAVNPTSVMGASKRLAELIVQIQAVGSSTSFCIVRFGNVLGSNGSVVPRFLDQIKRGGPVTITHPEIRRFFMLIPEAVQLVLHAAAQAEGGATYVLEMGEQVKVVDMARHLIRLSGFVPDEEIPIEFIGLRPGEKLFEELVGRDEDVGPSAVEKILRVTSRSTPRENLAGVIAQIESDGAHGRREAVFAALRELVGLSSAGEQELPAAPAVTEEPAPAAAARPAIRSVEQPCPNCGAPTLFRSKARNLHERMRRNMSVQRPFRCTTCQWRGWLIPLHVSDAEAVEPAAVPDLAALDVALQGAGPAVRPTFSPRDLH